MSEASRIEQLEAKVETLTNTLAQTLACVESLQIAGSCNTKSIKILRDMVVEANTREAVR